MASDRSPSIQPKTANQATYLAAIQDHTVTFGIGCAGTGKTYLALSVAVAMLKAKDIHQIVITRPNVSTGDKTLGFFKGTKDEKIAEWMRPAIKTLKRFLGPETFDRLLHDGTILLEPLETMRGETFDNAFVLLDEAQNVTLADLEMFLTRIGEHSTVVIDGDVEQTDLDSRSGLATVIEIVSDNPYSEIPVIEFGIEDVVRSKVCKDFIRMFRDHRREQCHA